MIQTDRTFWMYQLLMEYGRLSIPAVGTFTLEQRSSARNGSATNLKPPYTEVDFSTEANDDYSFALLLTEYGVMSRDEAKLEEKKLSDAYLEQKSANAPFIIRGFGEIHGDNFIPTEKELFNRYTGLHKVTLPVVSKPEVPPTEQGAGDMPSTSEVHSGGSSYWLWILAAFILAFFAVVFVQSTVMLSRNNQWQHHERKATHKSDNRNDSIKKALPETPFGAGSPDQRQGEENPSTMKTDNLSQSDKNKRSTEKSSCIIVVGTYKNSRNIAEMKSRVEALGYQSYVGNVENMTRVGVAFDCGAVSPDSFLQQIRLRIQPDAWLLEQ
jgi:hypothetical protein